MAVGGHTVLLSIGIIIVHYTVITTVSGLPFWLCLKTLLRLR